MENQESRAIEEPVGKGPDVLTAGQAIPQGSSGGGTAGGTDRLEEVSAGIRKLKEAGFSNEHIGKATGVCHMTIAALLKRKTKSPKEETLHKLEDALTNPSLPDLLAKLSGKKAGATNIAEQEGTDRQERRKRWEILGPALKARREMLGIGYSAMADRLGWAKSYVKQFENVSLPSPPGERSLNEAEAEINGRPRHRYAQKKFSRKMVASLLAQYRQEEGIETREELARRLKISKDVTRHMEMARGNIKQGTIGRAIESMIADIGEEEFDRLLEMAKGGKGSLEDRRPRPSLAPVAEPAPVDAHAPGKELAPPPPKLSRNGHYAPMRIKVRLLRELPGVSVGAEWWWPPRGEWVVKLKDNSREATNFLKTFAPEFMVANSAYFQILAIDAVKE